jgi:hypothetical protein
MCPYTVRKPSPFLSPGCPKRPFGEPLESHFKVHFEKVASDSNRPGGIPRVSFYRIADIYFLLKRAAEVGENPKAQEINAQNGLDSCQHPHPTRAFEEIFSLLNTSDPVAHIELSPADIESG